MAGLGKILGKFRLGLGIKQMLKSSIQHIMGPSKHGQEPSECHKLKQWLNVIIVYNHQPSSNDQQVNVDENQVTNSPSDGGLIQHNPIYLRKMLNVKQTLVRIIFHYSFLFACYMRF